MIFFIKTIVLFCPWYLKRLLLVKLFKYDIDKSAYIGLSWIYPKCLIMKSNSKIGHFNVAIHLDKMFIDHNSVISRSNWITGFSTMKLSKHFSHQKNRRSELLIGKHSSITKKHHIDCTNLVSIGDYVTIAGYQSQILTHSIDVVKNRQDSKPIVIGNYTLIGTNSVLLGGSNLPSYSILGAKSLLNKSFSEEWCLYAGVPANFVKNISKESEYFSRDDGFVY